MPDAKPLVLNYAQRLVLTFIAVVTLSLTVSHLFGMPLRIAVLVCTPGCLLLGSMLVLFHLARFSDTISAKQQLVTILVVEFLMIPTGATLALVAFFLLQQS